jgi:hypothetical protein
MRILNAQKHMDPQHCCKVGQHCLLSQEISIFLSFVYSLYLYLHSLSYLRLPSIHLHLSCHLSLPHHFFLSPSVLQETKIIQKRGRAANNLLHFLITLLYLAESEIHIVKDDIKINLPMNMDRHGLRPILSTYAIYP